MSDDDFETIESRYCWDQGVVADIIQRMSSLIASKKDLFIRWLTNIEIEQNVQRFTNFDEFGNFDFYNVFGALGIIDIHVKPALNDYFTVTTSYDSNLKYTPVKLQCSCDVNGFLQSSFVLIPKTEAETKNSKTFEMSPIYDILRNMESEENYIVADQTFSCFPFLLTPHEKSIQHASEFNQALDSKRKVIDKTFAKIQLRFPILSRIELTDAESVCNLIETVCILHNFFLANNDEAYMRE